MMATNIYEKLGTILYIKNFLLINSCRHGSRAGVLDTFEGHGAPITGVSAHYGQGTLDFSHLFLTASMDWKVKLWSLKVKSRTF